MSRYTTGNVLNSTLTVGKKFASVQHDKLLYTGLAQLTCRSLIVYSGIDQPGCTDALYFSITETLVVRQFTSLSLDGLTFKLCTRPTHVTSAMHHIALAVKKV